jgi:hypothetical protein
MEIEGTVIWYKPELGRGVVRLDGGKQYMFSKVQGFEEIEPLLRVRVLHAEKGPAGAVVAAFEDGRKEFGAPLRPLIRRRPGPGGSSTPRNPDAPPDGTIVTHPNYGRGMVVGATAKMIRVRFDGDTKDRTIRPSGVEISE